MNLFPSKFSSRIEIGVVLTYFTLKKKYVRCVKVINKLLHYKDLKINPGNLKISTANMS